MTPDVPAPDFKAEVRKLRDCLQAVDFLYQLKLEELDKLMAAMKKRRYPANTVVIKQGDKGDAFFMVASGKCSVWVGGKQVAMRYAGEYFGETALINDAPRSATIKTEADTELYILYKEDFKKILMSNPGIAAAIKVHMAKLKVDTK